MKFLAILALVSTTSAIRKKGDEFPMGSVNNMNYKWAYDHPPPEPDLRKCQEKVPIDMTLRDCKKDIAGFTINPGKI